MLERTVSETLKRQPTCMVPEEELERVWPHSAKRHDDLVRFAADNRWQLASYIKGRGAIFVRKPLA